MSFSLAVPLRREGRAGVRMVAGSGCKNARFSMKPATRLFKVCGARSFSKSGGRDFGRRLLCRRGADHPSDTVAFNFPASQ